jgi:hypothetical protein
MTNINEQLRALYESKWRAISIPLWHIAYNDDPPEPTNPLLLHIDKEEEWQSADLRVMFFGQETNDWEGYGGSSTVENLLGVYDRFFNKGGCWEYSGSFWQGIRLFENMLDASYPGKRIRYVWNNITKVGKSEEKGRAPEYIYELELEHFHVIPDEVRILKPDIIVFFTGPYYADAIRDNFGDVVYTPLPPYTERQLARVSIPEIGLAIRTYHPNYLLRSGTREIYFNSIVKEINECKHV